MKSYVDDDFVKGKLLHKELYTKSLTTVPLIKKFSSAFEAVFSRKCQEELVSLKKNDFMVRYYALSFIIDGQNLASELINEGITSKNIKELDISKFTKIYDLLVEDINKFVENSNDTDRIKKEGLA